jgi:hypothetical protein
MQVARKCKSCGKSVVGHVHCQTLVGYFSPKGHDHDDNCKDWRFECVCGHVMDERGIQNTCPTCDWKGKSNCNICGTRSREWND